MADDEDRRHVGRVDLENLAVLAPPHDRSENSRAAFNLGAIENRPMGPLDPVEPRQIEGLRRRLRQGARLGVRSRQEGKAGSDRGTGGEPAKKFAAIGLHCGSFS